MIARVYDVDAARERIAPVLRVTPLLASHALSGPDARTWIKAECLQVTGSFKARGATSKVLSLTGAERARGVIACSSGNHGLATAWVCAREGIRATICVPEWVDPAKLRAIRAQGATAVVEGATAEESEAISWRLHDETGAVYVHPFDDPEVIAGQGTIGLEIAEAAPTVREVVVPLSGGGLIGGIALAVKERIPGVRVVAAYAERAAVMVRSVEAGRLVQLPEEPTLATALAGNLGERNDHTLSLVSELVDEMVPVTEEEMREAIRFAWAEHRLVVEGGGSVALAAARRRGPGEVDRVVVVSGGNIDLGTWRGIVESEE